MSKPAFVLRVNKLYITAFMVNKYCYRPILVLASAISDAMIFNEQDALYFAGYLSCPTQVVFVERL